MVRKCAVKVKFKREEKSPWEFGIGVGEDPSQLDVIVTTDGKAVGEIWDFVPHSHEGLIWFNI